MSFEPVAGDVIRYDFLWKEEHEQGRIDGAKDRPCSVVLTTPSDEYGNKTIVVAPITHTPPNGKNKKSSIEIPAKVAKHVGLDDRPSWIRTDQVNVFTWEKGRIPVGLVPVKKDQWTYGSLPDALNEKIVSTVRKQSLQRQLRQVRR